MVTKELEDRSGNPARVNTRSFLLPIDLKEKNLFSRKVLDLDGLKGVEPFISVYGNFWVSLFTAHNHEFVKKLTLKNLSWRDSLCYVENVNKNINRAKGSELRLERASKTLKELKSTLCVSKIRFPLLFLSFLSFFALLSCFSFPAFSFLFYLLILEWGAFNCNYFLGCCCFDLRSGTSKENFKSLQSCSRLILSLGTQFETLVELPENLIESMSPDKRSRETNDRNCKRKASKEWAFLKTESCFSSRRHKKSIICKNLTESLDVEVNPGPTTGHEPRRNENQNKGSIEVISYNVRGLNDQKKLRHLINHCYKKGASKNKDQIFCFQETFIERAGILPLLWRGNFHLTPGRGNSSGCLTLLSHHINVIYSKDFGNKAHVLVCQKTDDQKASFIITNIYAPNANNNLKVTFFEEIFNEILELQTSYDCENTLVMGDFNLIFKQSECKNRAFSSQEKTVARAVKPLLDEAELLDINLKDFTWRRPNSEIFSTIDRIFYQKNLRLTSAKANWSLSMSDHAAIEANFELPNKIKTKGTRIPRLDPSLLKIETYKTRVKQEVGDLMSQIPNDWSPHTKLEYIKMCIRTVMEKLQAERKSNEVSEEELLNVELDLAIKALARDETRNRAELVLHIEDLRSQKEVLVESKGQRLADKLGTKWYQEGEKSTRYFLRILNRTCPDNFKELSLSDGEIISDPKRIEKEIVSFYKNLYEDYDRTILQENDDEEFFNEIIPIDDNKSNEISAPITLDKLARVLRTTKDSAPGPDGIPYSIWKELWEETAQPLLDSWNYSLQVGKLPPSHKISFLKLIPKQGKDSKLLTNWRPITLSNCDHKMFTKLYANRITERIVESLGENQTAYLKGRLINDNIRSLIANIKIVNSEENLDSLIISLDAKKAFDSVEHSFIEKCLHKFGLGGFVPIFKMLYSELRSDIIVNGVVVPGYNIKRGVKQGDALSCVLFIMCMEPLIRNIEKNAAIEPLISKELNSNLPKTYAYADDVNCVTKNNLACVQEIFKEYERLSKLSGLVLNADKTEILKLKSANLPNLLEPPFRINYLGEHYQLRDSPKVKVNGIQLCQKEDDMRNANVEAVALKIDNILKKWSRRNLSVLGKVLILKTFGISQIIYLLQSMCLKASDFKLLNSLLYKFLWNRNYLAAKAPERIKREIMNKPIKLGGFGMLDIMELDNSLKLKALGRLEGSKHPMLLLLKNKVNLSEFFKPSIST